MASSPPSWPFESGNTPAKAATDCVDQVIKIFEDNAVAHCGKDHTFIGETGYNTGCPGASDEANHISVAESFFPDLVSQVCQKSYPLFLFAYADACPDNTGTPPNLGCLAGCATNSIGKTPPSQGNGYFGVYHTKDYKTEGDLVLKYTSVPKLSCP